MKITHTEDYKKLRASDYPDMGEQMDALWHAMNDYVLPRIEPFYTNIKQVKDKYPKPVAE